MKPWQQHTDVIPLLTCLMEGRTEAKVTSRLSTFLMPHRLMLTKNTAPLSRYVDVSPDL